MSTVYYASQYDRRPCQLNNWEVPSSQAISPRSPRRKSGPAILTVTDHPVGNYGHYTSPRKPTAFVAAANGHLMQHVQKLPRAFNSKPQVGSGKCTVRWPEQNQTIPTSPRSTMGYKGIQTNYLASNTVKLAAECYVTNTR
ncbi:hypothetical protein M885DRAFT_524337 [Pelagophyceae sp. CCMP2097]|nr:hypothetical protein M885DRAFT_524337 [Pelagophyceae sp. CCMP2097]